MENCVERVVEAETLLDDGDEQVSRDGNPYLGLDGVLGSAKENLDAQMLLDPFERRTYILPTGFQQQKS